MRYYVREFVCGNWQTDAVVTARPKAFARCSAILKRCQSITPPYPFLPPKVCVRQNRRFVEIC